MTELSKYRTESLTKDELDSLTKDLNKSYLAGFIIGLMVIVVCLMMIIAFVDKVAIEHIIAVFALIVLTMILTMYYTKNLRKDISNGKKLLKEYEILDKKSFMDDDPGLGGYITRFHLITGAKKFSVDNEIYESADIHSYIVEHEAPLTGEVLKLEIKK